MKIKFKKLTENAVVPTMQHATDAGFDLTATSVEYDKYGALVCGTGIAMEIPIGYVGLVFPRSSVSKTDLTLTNCVGVIDAGYRGEITAKFKRAMHFGQNAQSETYKVGDRCAQLIILPYPQIEFEEADTLSDSDRGIGGYGSTGK